MSHIPNWSLSSLHLWEQPSDGGAVRNLFLGAIARFVLKLCVFLFKRFVTYHLFTSRFSYEVFEISYIVFEAFIWLDGWVSGWVVLVLGWDT